MAVGKLLNQVKEAGYRDLFLGDAIRQGATARTVQVWVDDVKRTLRNQEAAQEAGIVADIHTGPAPYTSMDACGSAAARATARNGYRKIHASCYACLGSERRAVER